MKTNEEVAIKTEAANISNPVLQYESMVTSHFSGLTGFPVVHWRGVEGDFNAMVIQILGPSLDNV